MSDGSECVVSARNRPDTRVLQVCIDFLYVYCTLGHTTAIKHAGTPCPTRVPVHCGDVWYGGGCREHGQGTVPQHRAAQWCAPEDVAGCRHWGPL